MKHYYSLLFVFLCLSAGWAQSPQLYGIYRAGSGPWNNTTTVPIARMDITTGVPLSVDSIPNVNAVVLGSSTFDQSTQEYIFSGLDLTVNNQPRVFKANVNTGSVTNTPALTETVNEYQYDLQQQKLFGLGNYVSDSTTMPPDYRVRLLTVNPVTGLVTELFKFPEVSAVVSGGSTFNSDSARIIFEGVDTLGEHRMYVIDVLTGAVVQNAPMTAPQHTFFNEWEYDHASGKLYGLMRDNNANIMSFVEYDLALNSYAILDTIPGLIGLTPAASVFDQATSTFIFQGVDAQYDSRLITIDANLGQITYNVPLSGYFIELEIDNSTWGENRYGSTIGLSEENGSDIALYPNPAANQLALEAEPGAYRIVDVRGVLVKTFIVPQGTYTLDLSNIPAGAYWVMSEDGPERRAFVKR